MFYYDADCGLCLWSLGWLRRMTTGLRSAPGGQPLIQRSAYFVDEVGRVHLGHKAISLALRRHGRSPLIQFLGVLCGLPPAAPIYRWVAAHRSQLGSLVGANACAFSSPADK